MQEAKNAFYSVYLLSYKYQSAMWLLILCDCLLDKYVYK